MGDPEVDSESSEDDVQYYVIDDVEPLWRYCPGGYHVVNIGDRLNNRYQIIHKLGFGSYSTAWLARDEHLSTNVGIKILVAESDGARERSILSSLRSDARKLDELCDAGRAAIPVLLDEFKVNGPNGQHHCLVTPPARISIAVAADGGEFFPLPMARAIVAQLVQAVAYLHQSGVVHGDLNLGNVLFELPDSIKTMTSADLYLTYGEPECETVERVDGKPIRKTVPLQQVQSARLWHRKERLQGLGLKAAKILLTDFGVSFRRAEGAHFEAYAPLILRPPEQLNNHPAPVNYESDIWALGCDVFQILGNRSFVEGWFVSEDRALFEQVEVLGRLPDRLWNSWAMRDKYFTEDLERVDGKRRETLRQRMDFSIGEPRRRQGIEEMSEEETQALEDLFREMLALDERERITAQQVLESRWMVEWALPDLRRAQELWRSEEREATIPSLEANTTSEERDKCASRSEDAGQSDQEAADSGEIGVVAETSDADTTGGAAQNAPKARGADSAGEQV